MKPSVLFLTSGRRVPSSRFRVGQYLERLRAEGFRFRVVPCVPQKYLSHHDFRFGGLPLGAALFCLKASSRILALLRAPHYDIVYVERELLPHLTPLLEEASAALNRRLVFDFDDAIFLRYGERDPNPIGSVCALARLVIAGNRFLADFARLFARRIEILPTPIDTGRWQPLGIDDDRLVWTGTSSNLPFLEALPLRNVPLRVICDRRPSLPCDFVPWSEEAETHLSGIGIMPLPDTDWSRGKCGFKLLQYMACGLPSIASPVGVNPDILAETGRLARDADEWIEAVREFRADRRLRERLGRAARARVESLYSVERLYPRWRDSLLSVL